MIIPLFLDTDDRQYFPADARKVISDICRKTDMEVRTFLPMLVDDVELEAQTGPRVIPETGATASAISRSRIRWIVDPSLHGGIISIAETQLRRTLFHELHHLARGWVQEGDITRRTLMDAVVSEGLATAFERDSTGWVPPWGEYPKEVTAWVTELLCVPHGAPYRSWMFKHPDGRRWIGYRSGVYIVDQAQKRTGLSAADLVRAPTAEVLKLAEIEVGSITGIVIPNV